MMREDNTASTLILALLAPVQQAISISYLVDLILLLLFSPIFMY